ncbi:MAG: thioredoxin family protein [Myxococcaceae bacterium]|nr:thioredoxin family protein [Myxococcaceae bacterium]
MGFARVFGLAVLGAIALAVVPELLPTGPTTGLDAAQFLEGGRMLVAAGVIFLGGLLTSLTPCVYPLIPITVGVFGARKAESRGKAIMLTVSYVVGMGVVFSALGVVAALSGKAFGSALSSALVIVILALFMLLLASSMFGAFELALPTGLATRLNTVGGAGFTGAFLMGSVSGFLAAPCTGPVLTGVLAWVGRTQDPVLGAVLLFIYALGIGVPFFLIGVFTVRLPKGGAWMDSIKSVFGIALVALAAGYLRDGFPAFRGALESAVTALGHSGLIGVSVLLALIGVSAGAVHLSFKDGAGPALLKGLGVALVATAILIRTTSIPLPELAAGGGAGGEHHFRWSLTFKGTDVAKGTAAFDQALADAKAACKPVMIDFGADWCAACNELERITYRDTKVAEESERFVNIKVDGTDGDEVVETLYQRYGVKGLPTVAFVDPMGEALNDPKITGFLNAPDFISQMKKVRLATCSRSP